MVEEETAMPESHQRTAQPRSLPPPLPPTRAQPRSLPPALPPRASVIATKQGLAAIAPAVPHPAPPIAPTALPSSASSSTGIDSTATGLVTLPPAFLEALRRVVPRRRRAKLPYVVGLGLLAVVGVLGNDLSTREFIAERWHHAPIGAPHAAALAQEAGQPTADRIVPPASTSDQRGESPVPPFAATIESASGKSATGTAAKPKKTRPRRAAPQANEKPPTSGS
jgi:hypothetical protein